MCLMKYENLSHLFSLCPFAIQVWKDVSQWLCVKNVWQGGTVEEGLKVWFQRQDLKNFRAVPFINLVYGWLAMVVYLKIGICKPSRFLHRFVPFHS